MHIIKIKNRIQSTGKSYTLRRQGELQIGKDTSTSTLFLMQQHRVLNIKSKTTQLQA